MLVQVYYYNALTKESSWSKPEGFTGDVIDAKPTSQLRVPGTQWYEIHCEDGRKYYYNDASEVIVAMEALFRMSCLLSLFCVKKGTDLCLVLLVSGYVYLPISIGIAINHLLLGIEERLDSC